MWRCPYGLLTRCADRPGFVSINVIEIHMLSHVVVASYKPLMWRCLNWLLTDLFEDFWILSMIVPVGVVVAVIRLATCSAAHPRRFVLVFLLFFLSSYLYCVWRLSWRCLRSENDRYIIHVPYLLVNYRMCHRIVCVFCFPSVRIWMLIAGFLGYDQGEGLIIFVLTFPIHGCIYRVISVVQRIYIWLKVSDYC